MDRSFKKSSPEVISHERPLILKEHYRAAQDIGLLTIAVNVAAASLVSTKLALYETESLSDKPLVSTKSGSLRLKPSVQVSLTMSERLPRRESYNCASLIALT